ncbi:YdcF family protein [Actinoplanes sp. ATCC 53533]|uniref:ElyC/SanA/YdcF family protein n=1 Tax=Actinoplanes sp. ATCC 53533 TaxID=1288362 RepID=UPI000F770F26|nr:ElyC/SanA/YdcF family protein [Actinoplanes sp. ATCC 53533]RSM69779.1 YdcF family protein [Actinoplanes sp. ATCC 53533]
MQDQRTAAVLLVFGRGVIGDGGRYTLTPASAARVQAAVDYAAARPGVARIVFAGGWAEAAEGAGQPPAGRREGDLMLAEARAAGLDRHADLRAETRSRSTLENLLHTAEDGLLDGYAFDAVHPLGLVSHREHLPRIRFLAAKVLGLPARALLDVPATGGETPLPWRSERAARLIARLGFLGARDPSALLRRERRMVATLRRAERLLRSSAG